MSSQPVFSLSPAPVLQFFDNDGNELSGGKLFIYLNNTATKALTYVDALGFTPNANPIILDARGEASIFLPPGQLYTYVLSPSTDTDPPTNPFYTQNNVGASSAVATVNFSVDTGTANNYVTTINGVANLFPGLAITLQIANTNTGPSTLNINSIGPQPIILQNGSTLGGGELQAGGDYILQYTTNGWQILQTIPYPVSAGETANGIVVINVNQPWGCVERYGNNVTPGMTDMTAAWQSAVKLGIATGIEVTYGSSGQHLLTAPINCTYGNNALGQFGIRIRNLGAITQDGAIGGPTFSIIARHNGVCVFDFTGNKAVFLEGLDITTDLTTFPGIGFLTARNQFGNGNSLQFTAIKCKLFGKFLLAPYYNYGSEGDCLLNCIWYNFATTSNTKTRVYTSTNIFNVASAFTQDQFGYPVSVASGTVSCIIHHVYSNFDYNGAGSSVGVSDCVYLDAVQSYMSFGGWANCSGKPACPTNTNPVTGGGVVQAYAVSGIMTVSLVSGTFTGALAAGMQVNGGGVPPGTQIAPFGTGGTTGTGGVGTYTVLVQNGSNTWASSGSPVAISAAYPGRALFFVDMTNGASDYCVIHGFTGEVSAPLQNYGILFYNPNPVANNIVNWDVQGCKLPAAGYAITCSGANAPLAVLNSCNFGNIGQQIGYGSFWPGTLLESHLDGTPACAWNINIATDSAISGDLLSYVSINSVNGGSLDHTGPQPTFTGGIVSGFNGWTFTGSPPTLDGKYNWIANEMDFSLRIIPGANVTTAPNATFTAPAAATDTFACEVIDATSGTLLSMALWTGSTITIPNAITTTGDTLIIKGRAAIS